jgi:hypothetical protein
MKDREKTMGKIKEEVGDLTYRRWVDTAKSVYRDISDSGISRKEYIDCFIIARYHAYKNRVETRG